MTESTPPRGDLTRGVLHTASGQFTAQAVRLLSNLALAHLLVPEDFGVVAVALILATLIDQLKDLGTGAAIIQRKTLDDGLVTTIFYLNVALGILMALGLFASAPILAVALGNPEATPVIRAFAPIVFVTSLGQVHQALLRRHLHFGKVALVTAISAVINAIVSVLGALAGFGHWALVAGAMIGAAAGCLSLWLINAWRPGRRIDLAGLRGILGFSLGTFASNFVFVVLNQADKAIIGSSLGPGALGLYSLGQRTVTSPGNAVTSLLTDVTFPSFSRRQDDLAVLRASFVKAVQMTCLVMMPAMFGLAAVAPLLVRFAFGADWLDMVPLMQVLGPTVVAQTLLAPTRQIITAKGRADLLLGWNLGYLCAVLAGVVVGLRWGLTGAATGYAIGTVLALPAGLLLVRSLVGVRIRDILTALAPTTVASLGMVAAVLAAQRGFAGTPLPPSVLLLLQIAVGVVVFAAGIRVLAPPLVQEFRDKVFRRARAS